MMSMLTRLRDYAKLLFTREQKLCLVNNAFTAPDATLQEEVLIVSPTPEEQPSVPEQQRVEAQPQPVPPKKYVTEKDVVYESFKKLTPEYLFIITEMRNLLNSENKKFVFSHIAQGARAKNYKSAITWLTQAGITTLVRRISKPGIPLSPYADDGSFKLFLLDVGLLGAMAQLDKETVIGGSDIFKEFKGSLTEQYVCQQLVSDCGLTPYYWSAENSSGEIDFLVQNSNSVYAIEVKAEENLRSRSLRAFKKSHPEIKSIRFSMSDYRDQGWMKNIPLYAMTNMRLWN